MTITVFLSDSAAVGTRVAAVAFVAVAFVAVAFVAIAFVAIAFVAIAFVAIAFVAIAGARPPAAIRQIRVVKPEISRDALTAGT